jgi:hypothetical protein
VLLRVQSGRLRVSDACVLIGLQRRQVFRLLRGLKQDGTASLLSKRRGQPSNHRLPAEVRTLALSIVQERYGDFGPSLAAEKLAQHHGCSVSRETLRGSTARSIAWFEDRGPPCTLLAFVDDATSRVMQLRFVTVYNTRFGRDPANNAKDLHRPLAPADDLDEILAWREEERTVTRNLALHYDRMTATPRLLSTPATRPHRTTPP